MYRFSHVLYAVVKFPEENGVLSVVPFSWLSTTSPGTLCRWPPSNVPTKKASKKLLIPTDEWGTYNAVPVHYSSKLSFFFQHSTNSFSLVLATPINIFNA